jgi:hypothetical protein
LRERYPSETPTLKEVTKEQFKEIYLKLGGGVATALAEESARWKRKSYPVAEWLTLDM